MVDLKKQPFYLANVYYMCIYLLHIENKLKENIAYKNKIYLNKRTEGFVFLFLCRLFWCLKRLTLEEKAMLATP
jgi:hypothetical protein